MFDEKDLQVRPLIGEQFALPQREGPVDLGKAQEFAMSHVGIGDFGNIRTVEFVQPDGTIARLRTRGGYPVFETDNGPNESTPKVRGFVAKVAGGRAVLFNPYSLTVLNSSYAPAGNHYSVQDFATSWNVPVGDVTHWCDVVIADGTVKINVKTMPALGNFGTLSATAVPYILNRGDTYDQYGNAEINASEKRYFEVERWSVKTWGGAGSSSVLTPTSPRTDEKAMTVGPRIDASSDTAWLGQLYYTGAVWSSDYGSWAISYASVAMLLTAPYLTKVSDTSSVESASYTPSWVTIASSGQTTVAIALPTVKVGVVGTGKIVGVYPYSHVKLEWPWDDAYSTTLVGTQVNNYTSRERISGEVSESISQFGSELVVSGSNQKTWTRENKAVEVATQYVTLPVDGTSNSLGENWSSDISGWHWVSPPPDSPGGRGSPSNYFPGDNIPLQGTSYAPTEANYDYELQEVSFSVYLISGYPLISCSIVKTRHDGEDYDIVPNNSLMEAVLLDPNSYVNVGGGYSYFNANFTTDGNPAHDAEQWPTVVTYANSWVGTKYYAANWFTDATASTYINFYQGVRTNKTNDRNATCSWTTRDWILFDEENGVYIYVEGSFSGSGTLMSGEATLVIRITVETRYHTTVITLATIALSYGEFMPDTYNVDGGAKTAIPSPKIPALFLPLYQEQGSFRGAHYVTLAEETNGAAPAHLFNFLLYLKMFDTVDSLDSINGSGPFVHIVPANLLEMLHSFVFSQQYGVGATRYPITSMSRYNAVVSAVFTLPFRVAVRDGVAGNWTDTFGADFAETSTISLHRT